MPPVLVASVSGHLTTLIGDHGLYAVFGLMVLAAVLPAASELVMLYAGAVAAGAFASAQVVLFGDRISTPVAGYLAMALAGVAGNTIGSVVGWGIGAFGGRPFLERHGRWLHVGPSRLTRAERWFDRFGPAAVLLGLTTPVVRSFIAIPAGIARMPLPRFFVLAFLGCIPFCFGLAGAGWALGASYGRLHSGLRYLDYAVVAGAVLLVASAIVRRRRSSRLARRAADPAR